MDSEDSHDGSGDAQSSSSSSSSSSRSRKSSSSSAVSNKGPKSPPRSPPRSPPKSPLRSPLRSPPSPKSNGPRSPSPSGPRSPVADKGPQSPMSGVHSDINSPENSMPNSPSQPISPDGPKSPSEVGSNIDHKERDSSAPASPVEGPKTPQSPSSSARSGPASPEANSQPASPDSSSQPTSPKHRSHPSSPSPNRNVRSPPRSPVQQREWSPKPNWRTHTKGAMKMVPEIRPRSRSRSESSQSSQSSSYNKRSSNKDPATEEISEGDIESDQEDRKSPIKQLVENDKIDGKDRNISHEDLSDVSDLDSMGNDDVDKQSKPKSSPRSPAKEDVHVNGDRQDKHSSPSRKDNGKADLPKVDKMPQEKTSNTEDCEEQLDFEAEEGECIETKSKETNGDVDNADNEKDDVKPAKVSRGSSLEEGEVSDEGERRPEETEPRPVCRFFSRGACTWGVQCRSLHLDPPERRELSDQPPVCRFFTRGTCARGYSCRFLHPGVTDKGNYNMFDVMRGVPPTAGFVAAPPREVPPPESAWERGLRTAKEMLRIANKRKEQDMDFEEKKLHLCVGGAPHDPDAELAYAAAAVGASPPRRDPHVQFYDAPPPPSHRDPEIIRAYGPMYRGRHARPPPEERERHYEREYDRGYEREREREREREPRYERPPAYDERAREPPVDDAAYQKRRVRSSREVIVQRAEVESRRRGEVREPRDGRGDQWADPWMRDNAPRRRRPPSSDDSYSSSSSSNSSSRSSRSHGAKRKRRASSASRSRLSPSVIVRERRLATARATHMNPPAPRRRHPSPAAASQAAANPPAPTPRRHKDDDPYARSKAGRGGGRDRKRYSRSSSSGSDSSSSSSDSGSDSHSSSSSGSSGARRARHARLLNAAARPRISSKSTAAGLGAAVNSGPGKKDVDNDKDQGSKKRSASSPVGSGPAKKSVSRREELLKQLKAVEDAIARKRSKI